VSFHGHIAQGLATSVACIAVALLAPQAWGQPEVSEQRTTRGDWRDPDAWKRLRLGMSPAQVVALLGEPGKVTAYYAFERWEYPDALGLRVNFDERGRLSAWGAFAR
jgi:outer membrane protein assembly factor BamE (lipoprotein component of BamABCDE complex)